MHPQAWPEELDYTGGRVVVIGSGATAVTLVPAMAERAAHVTMLQRSPSYVLAMPDGDLFRVIREGRASVVTGPIDTFTEQGLRLRSGEELAADIIATATGLDMLAFGGIEIRVDGEVRNPGEAMSYKGMMLCDVPNPAFAMGYINQSWTAEVRTHLRARVPPAPVHRPPRGPHPLTGARPCGSVAGTSATDG